jgi:hypothetical protein
LIFDNLADELKKYPDDIRIEALNEAQLIVSQFAAKIRKTAVEKDRILRGNGIQFPKNVMPVTGRGVMLGT